MRSLASVFFFAVASALDLSGSDESVLLQTTYHKPHVRMLYSHESKAESAAAKHMAQAESLKSLLVDRRTENQELMAELAALDAQSRELTRVRAKIASDVELKTGDLAELSAAVAEVATKLEAAKVEVIEVRSSIDQKKDELDSAAPALASIPRKTETLALRKATDSRDKQLKAKDDEVRQLRADTEELTHKEAAWVEAKMRLDQAREALKESVNEKGRVAAQIELVQKESKRISDLTEVMGHWKLRPERELDFANRLATSAGVQNDAIDVELEVVRTLLEAQMLERTETSASLLQASAEANDMDNDMDNNADVANDECTSIQQCKTMLEGVSKQNRKLHDRLLTERQKVAAQAQQMRLDLGAASRQGKGIDQLTENLNKKKEEYMMLENGLHASESDVLRMKTDLKVLETELAISGTWASKLGNGAVPPDGGDFDMSLLEHGARQIVEKNEEMKGKQEQVEAAKKEFEAAKDRVLLRASDVDAQTQETEAETARAREAAHRARAELLSKAKNLGRELDAFDQTRVRRGAAIRKDVTTNKGLKALSDIGFFDEQEKGSFDKLHEAWVAEDEAVKQYERKKADIADLLKQLNQ